MLPAFVDDTMGNETAQSDALSRDDAAWILSNAFLILTMQSGFGLLEAGSVSFKNIANIMVKNCVDVTLGGITYWSFGYGLSFGKPSNWFCGFGNFFVHTDNETEMGLLYTHYVFQFSFATAATTIVSGAVAERMKLQGYMIFSMINTFVYCIPVSWAWNDTGFLHTLRFFDFAGGCVVHAMGGASALVASLMLGPRLGRFDAERKEQYSMSSPVTALTGTFMLWWAWMAFNCGSTFGVQNYRWKVAAKVGVITLNGSISGGIAGLALTYYIHKGCFDVGIIITSVLGGLVGVTAGCAAFSPAEALLVGAIGAIIAVLTTSLLEKIGIDDPVGAIPVHLGSATWGTLAVGLFGKDQFGMLKGANGLLHGGGLGLLGIQLCGWLAICVWSAVCTAIAFLFLAKINKLRMDIDEEILGADWVEHKVRSVTFANRLENAIKSMGIEDNRVEEIMRTIMEQMDGKKASENGKAVIKNLVKQATMERTTTPGEQLEAVSHPNGLLVMEQVESEKPSENGRAAIKKLVRQVTTERPMTPAEQLDAVSHPKNGWTNGISTSHM